MPPKDVDALAAALETLIAEPEARTRMGATGELRALDYSWPTVAARVLQVYEETREAFVPRRPRPRRRVLGRYLRRLSGLFVPHRHGSR